MNKKIILVTGATDGIGKVTALELAKQGHSVIIHGRSEEKTKQVVDEIKSITGNEDVTHVIANLLSLKEVRKMADKIKVDYSYLDVLINNAGAVFDKEYRKTEDNLERTLALNTITPLVLSELLLAHLEKSQDGRIIHTSSESHKMISKVDIDDINFEKELNPQTRYGKSKLFVIWAARKQNEILKQKGIDNVTVNVSHPGMVATNFGQDGDKGLLNNIIYKTMLVLYKLGIKLADTPEEGASTNIYLATSDEVKGISGKYFGKRKEQKTSEKYYSEEYKNKLWNFLEVYIEKAKNINE